MNTTPTSQAVATIEEILEARSGTALHTIEHNPPLIVNLRENISGMAIEGGKVLAHGVAEVVTLTGDGRRYAREASWHEGPETGDAIFVERWNVTGRIFHGWIDPTSRRLVQVG